MPLYEIIPLEAVVGTCCVLDLYTYCKGKGTHADVDVFGWRFESSVNSLKYLSVVAFPDYYNINVLLQDGPRVWKSRMCTSVIIAWTSRLTCSTRSIVTATQSAPSHMPSTTSPSGWHPRETSRWVMGVLSGYGCSARIYCYRLIYKHFNIFWERRFLLQLRTHFQHLLLLPVFSRPSEYLHVRAKITRNKWDKTTPDLC